LTSGVATASATNCSFTKPGTGFRVSDKHSHFACKAVHKANGGTWYANVNTSISTETARAGYKNAVQAIGLKHELCSPHSAKLGAATEAVKAGSTDTIGILSGRWKSHSMAAAYVCKDKDIHAGILANFST
jgi:hypothetical protein